MINNNDSIDVDSFMFFYLDHEDIVITSRMIHTDMFHIDVYYFIRLEPGR